MKCVECNTEVENDLLQMKHHLCTLNACKKCSFQTFCRKNFINHLSKCNPQLGKRTIEKSLVSEKSTKSSSKIFPSKRPSDCLDVRKKVKVGKNPKQNYNSLHSRIEKEIKEKENQVLLKNVNKKPKNITKEKQQTSSNSSGSSLKPERSVNLEDPKSTFKTVKNANLQRSENISGQVKSSITNKLFKVEKFSAISKSPTSVVLSWSKPDNEFNVNHYKLFVQENRPDETDKIVQVLLEDCNEVFMSNLNSNSNYYFVLTPCSATSFGYSSGLVHKVL